MIAALPMYDRPENRAAHDAFWVLVRDGLRKRGMDAPEQLTRNLSPMDGWMHDDLILGQICNLPYRATCRERLHRLGCADYGVADTSPGYYRSLIVVRKNDEATSVEDALRGRLAYNEAMSHSGWGSVWDLAQTLGATLRPHLQTGAHVDSVRAIAAGLVDVAAIDAVSWSMFTRWVPETQKLRIVGRTEQSPGMTFVSAKGNDPAPIRAALTEAVATLPDDVRAILGLRGVVSVSRDAYKMALPPAPTT